jgi:hypothetical protein
MEINTRLETTFTMKYIVQVGVPVQAYTSPELFTVECLYRIYKERGSDQSRGIFQGRPTFELEFKMPDPRYV